MLMVLREAVEVDHVRNRGGAVGSATAEEPSAEVTGGSHLSTIRGGAVLRAAAVRARLGSPSTPADVMHFIFFCRASCDKIRFV